MTLWFTYTGRISTFLMRSNVHVATTFNLFLVYCKLLQPVCYCILCNVDALRPYIMKLGFWSFIWIGLPSLDFTNISCIGLLVMFIKRPAIKFVYLNFSATPGKLLLLFAMRKSANLNSAESLQ